MQVRRAVELMCKTEKTVLYVGGGVVASNGADELLQLAEKLNLPVTPTLMGLGCFPSGHKLCLGMLGMHGTYTANMSMAKADLIVSIGARFDDRVTGKLESFAKQATIVHVDVDPASVNKNVKVECPSGRRRPSQADARRLPNRPPRAPWWKTLRDWQGTIHSRPAGRSHMPSSAPLRPSPPG
jgi:acetolactate synthase-1/2/3 large subunit